MKTYRSFRLFFSPVRAGRPLARPPSVVPVLLLSLLLACPGRAAQITWTNTASGAWSTPANWSPNTVPGASDTAVIANAGVRVTLDISPTVGGIVLGNASGGSVTLALNNQTLTLNGPLTVNPSGSFTVDSGTLAGNTNAVLSGTLGWTAGSLAGVLTLASGGVLNLPTSDDHNMPDCTFTNNGTVAWSSGHVRTGGTAPGTVICNNGLWDSQGDLTLNLPYTGSAVFNNPGTFRKSASTGGSTFVYAAFNNTGKLDVQTGTVYLGGGGNFSGGTATNLAGGIVLNAGAFNLNGTAITTNLQLNGGTLTGNSVLNGGLNWVAGDWDSAPSVTVPAGSVLWVTSGNDHNLPNVALTNNGTVIWTGGHIRAGGTAPGTVICNNGLWDSQGDLTLNLPYTGSAVFNNPGTFRKSASTGGSTFVYAAFNNTGVLDVQTNFVYLGGGGNFTGGTATNLAGGIVLNAGAFNLNGTAITTNLQLNGGMLTGNNELKGGLNWVAGDWNSALSVTVPAGSVLWVTSANDHNLPNVTLTNNGTVVWTGGHIRAGGTAPGTVLDNNGLWDCQGDLTLTLSYTGSAAFNNPGLFRKSASTGGSTYIYGAFNNTGLLLAQTNAISLQGGGSLTGGILMGEIDLNAGAFNLNGAVTSIAVQLAGGELTGTTVINGGLNWISGDWNSAPSVTVTTNSVLYITSGNDHDLENVRLTNNGTVAWTGGHIRGGGTAPGTVIYNNGWWDAGGDLMFMNAYTGTTVFNNPGMFAVDGGTTVFPAGVLFTNTGQLDVQDGNIALQGAYALADGTKLFFGLGGAAGSGSLTLSGAAAFTGSLSVNLIGYYWPAAGSAFNLITGTGSGLNFTNLTLPSPAYIAWQPNYNPTAFILSVNGHPATNSAATKLALTPIASNSLLLQWPGDHTGWKLMVQTNSLAVGLNAYWTELTGSALTNQLTVPLDKTSGSVLYRLAD